MSPPGKTDPLGKVSPTRDSQGTEELTLSLPRPTGNGYTPPLPLYRAVSAPKKAPKGNAKGHLSCKNSDALSCTEF